MWLGVDFHRALPSLHDNGRGVVCYCSNRHGAHPSLYARAPVHCAQPPVREKTPWDDTAGDGSEYSQWMPGFFRHFSAPCLKRNHFLFLENDARIVHGFFVYVKSFLNNWNIAKWLVWSLCFLPCLDSISDKTSEISHRWMIISWLKAEFGWVSLLQTSLQTFLTLQLNHSAAHPFSL